MDLENNQLQFLWRLFHLYFIKGFGKEALQWVATMYEHSLEFPEKLESLLLGYWEDGRDTALIEAAIMAVRLFYFDPEQHAILIAVLVDRGLISVSEAASLLTFAGKNIDSFSKLIRHSIDVAWLINQDSKDGVLNAEQDTLLKDCLRNLLSEFKNGKI